jgi:hypothetical protein
MVQCFLFANSGLVDDNTKGIIIGEKKSAFYRGLSFDAFFAASTVTVLKYLADSEIEFWTSI